MPPRRSSGSRKPKQESSNVGLMVGIGGGAFALVVVVVFLAFQMGRSHSPAPTPGPPPAPVAAAHQPPPAAHAPPNPAPATPSFDQGPPPVPEKFVFAPTYEIDQKSVAPATAFSIRHPKYPSPIVLTSLTAFPKEILPRDLPKHIKKVTLSDKFSGTKLFEFDAGIIPIPMSAPQGTTSVAGDILAMWAPQQQPPGTVELAAKQAQVGEPVWMVTRVTGGGDGRLHKATVTDSARASLTYKFDTIGINQGESAGSPILNARGELLALHLGPAREGAGFGLANPVTNFQPYLEEGCSNASAPSRTAETPQQDLSGTDLVEVVEPSVVVIKVNGQYGDSIGSGFVIDKEGTLVTNYHVIEGAKSAVAMFRTKEEFPIKGWWALDEESDLALLKIDAPANKLHPVRLAKDLPRKGEVVAAFGAPHGLEFSFTKGDVSALRDGSEFKKKGQYIQTSAAISPGNSGGPLSNMRGEIVGVNSFKRASGENLNFAVSSADVKAILEKKGSKLGTISPTEIPDRSGGRIRAEDLTGTERATELLGRIQEAVVVIEGVTYDPTGRLESFVLRNCETAIDKQLKWKRLSRRDQPSASTAFMVILVYFDFDETKRDLVTEIHILMQVIARDVDKNRRPVVALVYKEDVKVGTVSINALVNGIIPRTLETSVPKAFNKLASTYKKAVRDGSQSKPDSKSDSKPETPAASNK